MAHVQITEKEIVHIDEIFKANRIGNYTQIWIRNEPLFRQIWDEEEKIWIQIEKAVNQEN